MLTPIWKRPVASGLFAAAALLAGHFANAASEWRAGVPRTAFATLFEWDWKSVARECTEVLGPKGYAAVQVSPPQEHPAGEQWWWRYQPVSFKLQSRSGSRSEFAAMIRTCRAAGVDVYVDAVINHMANYNGGRGVAGSSWGAREFPAVPWTPQHFHTPKCDVRQSDYNNQDRRDQVTQCDIPGLPDLDTGQDAVQQRLAAYLNDLYQLGVRGFRIDAAKHIRPAELAAIRRQLPADVFFTQEVMRDAGVTANGDFAAYQQIGQVNEFNYVYAMRNAFANQDGQSPSTLPQIFERWGFMPSDKATVFVHNHDTERNECSSYTPGGVCNSLSTLNGDTLFLAHAFMLAWPYGYPSVASGYYFNDREMGPPAARPWDGTRSNCSPLYRLGSWDCVHRDRRTANLVGLRNYAGSAPMSNWQQGNANQIAFSRQGRAFIAINNGDSSWQNTFATGLADGRYCNIVAAEFPERGQCPGAELDIRGGRLTLSLTPRSVVALHIGARPRGGQDCARPQPFSFNAVNNAQPASAVYSNTVTISGLECPAAIRVSGGRYSIDGGAFTASPGSIRNGQRLRLEARTPARPEADGQYRPQVVSVSVGPVTQTFSVHVQQRQACDDPDAFAFAPVDNAPAGRWVSSAAITVQGLECRASIRIEGGRYSIDGAPFTTRAGTIGNGQRLRVQVRTPAAQVPPIAYPPVVAVVHIGPDHARFVVNLEPPSRPPACPDAAAVCVLPAAARAGESATVFYKGELAASPALKLHWGINGWQRIQDLPMQRRSDGYWFAALQLPADARALDFAFTDGQRWDNRQRQDWHIPVAPCVSNCPALVNIEFRIQAPTLWGESVYMTGDHPVLGQWSRVADAARKCEPQLYPVWVCRLNLPANTVVEYKYIKLGRGEFWESGYNRSLQVPVSPALRHDGHFRP